MNPPPDPRSKKHQALVKQYDSEFWAHVYGVRWVFIVMIVLNAYRAFVGWSS